jgi:uncharacterized protein YjbI with pentapeptide repeats
MEILPSPRDHPLPFRPFLIKTRFSQTRVSAPIQSEVSVGRSDALPLSLQYTVMRLLLLLRELAPSLIAVILLTIVFRVLIFYRNYAAELFRSVRARLPKRVFEIIVALLAAVTIFGLILVLCQFALNVLSSLHYLWAAPAAGLSKDQIAAGNALRTNRIQIITAAVQSVGGLAVLVGIYFAWANLKTTQRAQRETLRLTNEGQITDRFIRAIDQLGSGQLEVRLGAVYALERIARDSAKDHWPIMEVLTAYVRVHAPIEGAHENAPATQPDPDIQAILTVIGRRDTTFEEGTPEFLDLGQVNLEGAGLFEANLSDAYLDGANLSGVNLSGASLLGASLDGTNLRDANLDGANLSGASLSHTNLSGASLDGANLGGTYLDVANLRGANLRGANLRGANLTSTNLTGVALNGANLTGTFLNGADLSGADLGRTDLSGANLAGADLDHADLSGAVLIGADLSGADLGRANLTAASLRLAMNLTQQQIDSANGNKDTQLPPGLVMPESWKDNP